MKFLYYIKLPHTYQHICVLWTRVAILCTCLKLHSQNLDYIHLDVIEFGVDIDDLLIVIHFYIELNRFNISFTTDFSLFLCLLAAAFQFRHWILPKTRCNVRLPHKPWLGSVSGWLIWFKASLNSTSMIGLDLNWSLMVWLRRALEEVFCFLPAQSEFNASVCYFLESDSVHQA